MYQLTYDSKILFDPYMQSTAITDAKYTGKSNSVSYLDFTIAPNHPLYNTIEKDKGLVDFYSDNVLKFRGKINEIEIDDSGYKIVACNSVLQYLNHTLVRSYSTVPGDADLTAPTSVEGYFQWLIDQHNLHVKDASERFEVGVNQGAALEKNDYILRSNDNYPTTLDEINDKILDSLGGYLFVEYKDDRNILNLYADVHSTNSQIIDFGSNILSISYKENDDELYTVVIPRGGTPEKKEGDTKDPKPINIKNLPDNTFDSDSDIVKSGDCVYSLSATKRYGYREYYYSNNDILDPSNLLKAAVLQLRLQMAPKVTIETKAIDLSIAYPGYEQLNIGDACRVRSARHNLDDYFMLSEMELDLNDPSQTTYTFGDEYVSLVGRQSNYLKQINSSIDRNYEDVNTAMSYGKAAAKLADAANKTADSANNTAVKANDKAQKATEDAFNANTTANKAQNTANSAKITADKAQTTATEAKTTADSVNKAAEELKKKTAEIDKQVEAASNAADAASAKADQVRTDLQKQVDANKASADAASAKADQVRTDLTNQVQNVKSEMDTAVEAAQTSANKAQSAADAAQKAADKANASTADLDKSIKAVDAKAIAAKQAAAEAQSKAENVASDLDSANAVIEQHTTELGELTTKVSNAVKKSDSALSVSTEAKQTATEASTTATSAYRDSQTALTQSTTATQTATAAKTTAESASKTATDSLKQSSAAVQTANQISMTLRTEYQTKADADKLYATQSSLKQTSDSITASVSKTYATKDALSALQNVADNAIESWRGTGVPTLENKPALDWTTNDDKKKHSGDLYYDKSTGKAYRFGSDDGVTYTWELNQDTDVTKALEDASKAQTSANNAQASATAANTAASKAQSTANTAVSNAATAKNAADAAQSSANKAQGDVDKLKIDIPETYATKSSLTQTAESITANVESVKTTANSAVTAASKAQQTADGISVNLTKNYQTKSQADTLYATKASLKATSDSISAEVTKAQGTADGAVTAASKAQQTADAVTLNLSKNYNTKAQNDALYATQTSLKATSDSLSANITANAKTAQSAVDKATSLEANLNGFKTTVSQTYGHGSNLWVNPTFDADKPQIGSRVDDVTAPNGSGVNLLANRDHHNNATSFPVVPGHTYVITAHIKRLKGNKPLNAGIWYTSHTSGNSWDTYSGYESTSDLSDEWLSATWRFSCPNGKSRGCVFFQIDQSASNGSTQWYVANVVCVDVTGLQPAGDYATNSSLTQTANSIKAEVTEVSKTANGAMSKATTVEQTASGLSTKITEQGKTLDATVKTANEAKSTADSNKTTISQTANLVDAALAGDNLITDGGFESTEWWKGLKNPFRISVGSFYHGKHVLVCDAATGDNRCPLTHEKGMAGSATTIPVTKGRTYRLSGYCAWYLSVPSNFNPSSEKLRLAKPDGSFITEAPCSKLTSWSETHVDWKCPDDGSITSVRIEVMHQTNGTIMWDDVAFRDITEAAATSNRVSSVEQNLNGFKTTVAETYQTKDGMSDYATNSSLTQTANSIKAQVTEVSKTANGAMSKATTVEQTANGLSSKITEQAKTLNATVKTANEAKSTADSNKATISQVSTTASSALTKASSVEQNLNGFKTTVSETYTTKTDTQDLRQMSALTYQLTGSGGKSKWVKIGYLVSNGDSTSILLHVYSGNGYNGNPGQNAEFEIFIKDGNNGADPANAANAFGVSVTRIKDAGNVKVKVMAFNATSCDVWAYMPWNWWDGRYTIQGSYHTWRSYPNNTNNTSETEPTSGTAQSLTYDSLSTKSYVDQTAKSVALGVVQNYKGADGSGLATKSDITASEKSITSTVSSTYATKSGVTQEISSKITQNNNSLDIKFATKTENQKAQNTADTANKAASNAQSRVGNLEPCIRMTAEGVRVGKQENGTYHGSSALVGTDGTFDVLNSSSQRLLEVSANGVKFPKSSDGRQLSLGYLSNSDPDTTSTLYIGDTVSEIQEGGPKNRLGFTDNEVSLNGGNINILAYDHQLSMYGRKGANLLVGSGGNVMVGGEDGSSDTKLILNASTVNLKGTIKCNDRGCFKETVALGQDNVDIIYSPFLVTVVFHTRMSNPNYWAYNNAFNAIREGYRPLVDVYASLSTDNGSASTSVIGGAHADGHITIQNRGGAFSSDTHYGSITYPVQI